MRIELENGNNPELPKNWTTLADDSVLGDIGRKWIDYARTDYDANDIAVAIWSAMEETRAKLGASVPDALRAEAEGCANIMAVLGSMDAEDIEGDRLELRFETKDGRDTGCDVSITEWAARTAKLIESVLTPAL